MIHSDIFKQNSVNNSVFSSSSSCLNPQSPIRVLRDVVLEGQEGEAMILDGIDRLEGALR